MSYYTIHLINVRIVQPTNTVREVIEQALQPLVDQAGHILNLVNIRSGSDTSNIPDVSLEFIRNQPRLGQQFIGQRGMMLAEQSGAVLVGNISEMRVGGVNSRTSTSIMNYRRPTQRRAQTVYVDYMSSMRPVFVNGEEEFARTVGNISVHELGHTIGGLAHNNSQSNFMFTGASLSRHHSPDWWTYDNLRRFWSGRFRFEREQRSRLVEAIRRRDLQGIETQSL